MKFCKLTGKSVNVWKRNLNHLFTMYKKELLIKLGIFFVKPVNTAGQLFLSHFTETFYIQIATMAVYGSGLKTFL